MLQKTTLTSWRRVAVACALAMCIGCGEESDVANRGVDPSTPTDVQSPNETPERPEEGAASIAIEWDPVSTNPDGTVANDVAGYVVYDGPTSGQYDTATDVGSLTSVVLQDLAPGRYYISVAAYDWYGNESLPSDELAADALAP